MNRLKNISQKHIHILFVQAIDTALNVNELHFGFYPTNVSTERTQCQPWFNVMFLLLIMIIILCQLIIYINIKSAMVFMVWALFWWQLTFHLNSPLINAVWVCLVPVLLSDWWQAVCTVLECCVPDWKLLDYGLY